MSYFGVTLQLQELLASILGPNGLNKENSNNPKEGRKNEKMKQRESIFHMIFKILSHSSGLVGD